jgi:hypothetical protein
MLAPFFCHWKLSGAVPPATTVKLAVCPAVTVWFAGGAVIVGGTGANVAVPASVMIVVGVCGSLLVMVMLPESVPADVGENDTVNTALFPGVIVFGVVMPETPNEPPLTEINDRIRLAPPAFVIVNVPLAVVPTIALPKFKLAELTPICCGPVVAEPVSATWPEESPLLVWSVRVPLAFPVALGVNHT